MRGVHMERSQLNRCRRRMEVAEGYLLLNLPALAVRELECIRETGRNLVDWHRLYGEALRMDQRHEEALRSLQQVQEVYPDQLDTLLAIAWCYKRVDRLGDAIATMKQAYDAHPRVAVVLYNMACYYALAGDKPLALSWLGRAIRMDPDLRTLIPAETDFDTLRDDPDFQFVIHNPTEATAD